MELWRGDVSTDYFKLTFVKPCTRNATIYLFITLIYNKNLFDKFNIYFKYKTSSLGSLTQEYYLCLDSLDHSARILCCGASYCEGIAMTNENIQALNNIAKLTKYNPGVILKYMESL